MKHPVISDPRPSLAARACICGLCLSILVVIIVLSGCGYAVPQGLISRLPPQTYGAQRLQSATAAPGPQSPLGSIAAHADRSDSDEALDEYAVLAQRLLRGGAPSDTLNATKEALTRGGISIQQNRRIYAPSVGFRSIISVTPEEMIYFSRDVRSRPGGHTDMGQLADLLASLTRKTAGAPTRDQWMVLVAKQVKAAQANPSAATSFPWLLLAAMAELRTPRVDLATGTANPQEARLTQLEVMLISAAIFPLSPTQRISARGINMRIDAVERNRTDFVKVADPFPNPYVPPRIPDLPPSGPHIGIGPDTPTTPYIPPPPPLQRIDPVTGQWVDVVPLASCGQILDYLNGAGEFGKQAPGQGVGIILEWLGSEGIPPLAVAAMLGNLERLAALYLSANTINVVGETTTVHKPYENEPRQVKFTARSGLSNDEEKELEDAARQQPDPSVESDPVERLRDCLELAGASFPTPKSLGKEAKDWQVKWSTSPSPSRDVSPSASQDPQVHRMHAAGEYSAEDKFILDIRPEHKMDHPGRWRSTDVKVCAAVNAAKPPSPFMAKEAIMATRAAILKGALEGGKVLLPSAVEQATNFIASAIPPENCATLQVTMHEQADFRVWLPDQQPEYGRTVKCGGFKGAWHFTGVVHDNRRTATSFTADVELGEDATGSSTAVEQNDDPEPGMGYTGKFSGPAQLTTEGFDDDQNLASMKFNWTEIIAIHNSSISYGPGPANRPVILEMGKFCDQENRPLAVQPPSEVVADYAANPSMPKLPHLPDPPKLPTIPKFPDFPTLPQGPTIGPDPKFNVW